MHRSEFYQPEAAPDAEGGDASLSYYEPPTTLPEPQELSSANIGRWLDLGSDTPAAGTKGPPRIRRRPTHGTDHVKHRRTRSGCYTCRQRRVKCDEHHPICERCKKGARECVYPEQSSTAKSGTNSKLGQHRTAVQDEGSSSEEYEDDDLDPVPEEPDRTSGSKGGHTGPQSASRNRSHQLLNRPPATSEHTTQGKEKSLSPSTDDSSALSNARSISSTLSTSGKHSSPSSTAVEESESWSHLSKDLQFYLNYHQTQVTYHHYFFKHHADEFIHSILVQMALSYDPLLYAVVGFAAYLATVGKANGKIQNFLGYYNKSVSLLRKSLQAGQKHRNATILTILQLAAFEEYLGDWVNLLGHQRASYEMLMELYSPETIMETELGRKTMSWYSRFDLFAGLMSGSPAVLSREWFSANEEYFDGQSAMDPANIDYKIERDVASNRLIAMDMALLLAKLPRNAISMSDFVLENNKIAEQLEAWKRRWDVILAEDSRHLVLSFEGAPDRDPNDIVDPYRPGGIYSGPLWTVNFMMMDWCALTIMHKYQTALMLQQAPPQDLSVLALEQCRIFEAIEFWPGSPSGSVLTAQASLGMAALFLPKDDRHTMWCRRKLAMVETQGYIFPPTFRSKMGELWGIPGIQHWWLPNDEGYPTIIRSIRSFIEERTLKPRNEIGEDVRSMKAIFSKMSMDDSPKESPESSASPPGDIAAYYSLGDIEADPMQQMSGDFRTMDRPDENSTGGQASWDMSEYGFGTQFEREQR